MHVVSAMLATSSPGACGSASDIWGRTNHPAPSLFGVLITRRHVLARPPLSLVRPPRVDDPISIEFMYRDLARSGLVPTDMGAYPLDSQKHGWVGAYLIPYRNPVMYRRRYDRVNDKYDQAKGLRDVWIPLDADTELMRQADTLYLIEGEKKAARFLKQWPKLATIGIGGAWNYLDHTPEGIKRMHTGILEVLKPGKKIVAIFDGDILTKGHIQMAATALRQLLSVHDCEFKIGYPPVAKGVDDWLQEAEDPKLEDIKFLPFESLEESKKNLYVNCGCHMNGDKLILNELNAKKLLAYYFGDDIFMDKRLGMIYQNHEIDVESLENTCVEYMQGEINAYYKLGAINNAARLLMHDRRRDLIQESLLRVKWDGVPRLDTWASEHFETDWPEWTNEWGRILMTGLALRILEPGTKVDKVCILAGPQGVGKSTFFENLSEFDGHKFYHACTKLSNSGADANRTQGQAFTRALVVDLAEGVVFETRKEALDTAKQIITQIHDEYRIAFAKSTTKELRGFIFVGTTNRTDQLSDATGSRRYMYIYTPKIKPLPYNIKLQILAEVVAREAEIRAKDWWIEEVDIKTMPEKYKQENDVVHITNVQELVNMQFTKADAQVDYIKNVIEARDCLHLLDTGELYLTAGYLAAKSGSDVKEFASQNMWSRKLAMLKDSPTFPYQLISQRKRIPQLGGGDDLMKSRYMSGITNNQGMVNGFIVRKK